MAELIPRPFAELLADALAGLERDRAVFHLPRRSFWQPRTGFDLSVPVGRTRAANPLGPAAGPHTQLAPNIVAAWLAGSRVVELKTVQVLDRLDLPRPCIDAPDVGYNVEWSQELRLADSARQYAAAWYLIHVLAARGLAGDAGAAGTVFDGSVGYDLEGIRSPGVARFLDEMTDASALLADMRAALPRELRAAGDVEVPARIVDAVTTSTFHGCPPDQIERIVEHLFARHALDVVVKLNPTLLGHDTVEALLHGAHGYDELRLDRAAFEADLRWDDALQMLDRLAGSAARAGRRLGVKFTNTLVVRNTRGRLAGDVVYASGPPLHVLAVTLANRFVRATGGRFPVSFSAGVDAESFADVVACGFAPVTTCTDLLKPTGYRRLPRYLKALEAAMEAAGAADLGAFARARAGLGPAAAAGDAERANLAAYAARVAIDERWHAERHRPPTPARGPLPVFDCESCNNCLLVCPNGAFHSVELPRAALASGAFVRDRQWVVLEDACNACGHCDAHCPQEGGPWRVKPRLHRSRAAFEGAAPADGALVEGGRPVALRRDGVEIPLGSGA